MSASYSFRFDEQLAMSHGIAANPKIPAILLADIPGAENVWPASATNDKNGTDFWVEHSSGKHLSVDCKIRNEDYAAKGKDDLALESWSIVGKKTGWTRDPNKRTDYVLWFWQDTHRKCLLPFSMLCSVFIDKCEEWRAKYGASTQFTQTAYGGYESECIFVP